MAEGTQTLRYYGVSNRSTRNGEKSYSVLLTPSPTWPAAVLQHCGQKEKLFLGTFKTEEAAASAVDQALYIIFRDQKGGSPRAPNLPDLLTADLRATLATVTLKEKIDEWALSTSRKRKENATSKYRGVRKERSGYFCATATHPLTGKRKYILGNPDEELCALVYDRQMLKWWGRSICNFLNFPSNSYLGDVDDPLVAQLAKEIDEGGVPNGEYGPYEDRFKLRAAYNAGTLDLNDPSTSAAATAVAAPISRRRPVNTAPARAAKSNRSSASDTTEMDAETHDSDDNSDEDYLSELEEEEDDEYLLCTINATYALLSPDEESEISEWLKEQGFVYPFPRSLEGGDALEELPDDPHGVLTHLAGPNWDVPPKTPEALKLWRSEIKRTVENFEEDVWKIAEALKEKNAGYDPENYKINGQYPDTHVHWLISNGYIDAEGNTLRKIPPYDQWIKEATVRREKEGADRKAAAEAGVEYVPPPKPAVPEGFKPFYSDPYFHLPPGLDKMYLPHGELALLSMHNYHACKTRSAIDRKIRQYQSFDGFYGPDGQLSLERIGEAFKLLGEQCVDAIHEMFQNDELRDWFIVNSAALYTMCGDAVSFLPKPEPEPQPEPTPELERQFAAIDGDCEDWAQLHRLVVQLGAATSRRNAPQKPPRQQEAESAVVSTDLQALVQEKCRNLNPAILSSARSRLAEIQNEEQQAQVQPPPLPEQQNEQVQTPLEFPPEYLEYVNQLAESSLSKLAQPQTQEQQGAGSIAPEPVLDCMSWVEALGEEGKIDEILALASAEMEALGVPTGFALSPPPAADAPAAVPGMETKEPFEEKQLKGIELEKEDFVQRWEHVAPGFAEKMNKAEADGYYNVIDSRILARQAQLVANGSAAVCKALNVENSIDQAIKDLVQRKRCEEWNWKVGLAVQQNLDHWLADILGVDYKAIIAAHSDGLVFGEHRRAPDMHDPLEIQGVYDDDERYVAAGMTRIQVYEMAWKEAQVDSTGPAMTFLDSLYRYWEPVILADPMFCGIPAKTQSPVTGGDCATTSNSAAKTTATAAAAAASTTENENLPRHLAGSLPTMKAKLISEENFDVDDIVFVTEAQLKNKHAGKKRRKDTHYFGKIIKY